MVCVWCVCVCVCVGGGGGGGGGGGREKMAVSTHKSTTRIYHFSPLAHFLALDNAPVSVRE